MKNTEQVRRLIRGAFGLPILAKPIVPAKLVKPAMNKGQLEALAELMRQQARVARKDVRVKFTNGDREGLVIADTYAVLVNDERQTHMRGTLD